MLSKGQFSRQQKLNSSATKKKTEGQVVGPNSTMSKFGKRLLSVTGVRLAEKLQFFVVERVFVFQSPKMTNQEVGKRESYTSHVLMVFFIIKVAGHALASLP